MEFSFGVALGFSIFICDSTGGGTESNVSPSFPMFPKVFREYHAKTSKLAARRQAWVWKWHNHKENLTFSAVSHKLFPVCKFVHSQIRHPRSVFPSLLLPVLDLAWAFVHDGRKEVFVVYLEEVFWPYLVLWIEHKLLYL